MSSTSSTSSLVWMGSFLGALAIGCGPSAPAQTPVQMVPVSSAVSCNCVEAASDDEGPAEPAPVPRHPTQYVRLSEWTPPPAAQRVESEIPARGNQPATYTSFGELSLHRGIPRTTVTAVPYGWGGYVVQHGGFGIPPRRTR